MNTLIQKWESTINLIKVKHANYLDDYFKDIVRPTIVYQINGWHSISEQTITDWHLNDINNWQPQYYKKPTRKDLQRLILWDESFILSEDKIFLYYKYDDGYGGRISGAHNLAKIKSDNRISFDKEKLLPILKELQEKYAPKAGHIPCTYCQKQIPESTAIDFTIIARQYPGMRKTSKYCSETCGANDQMAHEG